MVNFPFSSLILCTCAFSFIFLILSKRACPFYCFFKESAEHSLINSNVFLFSNILISIAFMLDCFLISLDVSFLTFYFECLIFTFDIDYEAFNAMDLLLSTALFTFHKFCYVVSSSINSI